MCLKLLCKGSEKKRKIQIFTEKIAFFNYIFLFLHCSLAISNYIVSIYTN